MPFYRPGKPDNPRCIIAIQLSRCSSRGEGEENHQSSDSGEIQSMVMNRVRTVSIIIEGIEATVLRGTMSPSFSLEAKVGDREIPSFCAATPMP